MNTAEVPFVPNSPDGTHCFQAALAMVIRYFDPASKPTFKELDAITNKKEGKWTWTMSGLLWFLENGFDVKRIERFDFRRFGSEGKKYLEQIYNPAVADAQEKNSNLIEEAEIAQKFQKIINPEYRIPGEKDLVSLLKEGYLLICNVNSRILNDKEGYVGHFVVVYDMKDGEIFFHDPGLPPQKARRMSLPKFEVGWAYPEKSAKNITAIRPRKIT